MRCLGQLLGSAHLPGVSTLGSAQACACSFEQVIPNLVARISPAIDLSDLLNNIALLDTGFPIRRKQPFRYVISNSAEKVRRCRRLANISIAHRERL
jgi:hypothetical protein